MGLRLSIRLIVPIAALVIVMSGVGVSPIRAEFSVRDFGSLAEVDGAIAQRRARLEDDDVRIKQIAVEVEGLNDRRVDGDIEVQHRVRALYRLERAGVMPLAGGFGAMIQHLARVSRMEALVERGVDASQGFVTRSAALAAERDALITDVASIRTELEALTTHQASLASDEQGRVFRMLAAGRGIGGAGSRVVVDANTTRGPFASREGNLSFPIQGAESIEPSTTPGSNALVFVTRPGAQVRNVADGAVVLAGDHPAFGSAVIVDHGEQFFTVYSPVTNVRVMIGDWVPEAMPLGEADENGAMTFDIRRGAKSISARKWLGL